jgi:hypothetical protein
MAQLGDVKPRLDIQSLRLNLSSLQSAELYKLLANLVDMYNWTRGEDVIVPLGNQPISVAASTRSQIGTFGPGTQAEEWDYLLTVVIERPIVDAADTIAITLISNDEVPSSLNNALPLNNYNGGTSFVGSDAVAELYWLWPNWNSTPTSAYLEIPPRIRPTSVGQKRQIGVIANTTASVGARSFYAFSYIRRRNI